MPGTLQTGADFHFNLWGCSGVIAAVRSGTAFDPITVQVLRSLLDEIWDDLPQKRKNRLLKSELAARLLELVGNGPIEPESVKAQLRDSILN